MTEAKIVLIPVRIRKQKAKRYLSRLCQIARKFPERSIRERAAWLYNDLEEIIDNCEEKIANVSLEIFKGIREIFRETKKQKQAIAA